MRVASAEQSEDRYIVTHNEIIPSYIHHRIISQCGRRGGFDHLCQLLHQNKHQPVNSTSKCPFFSSESASTGRGQGGQAGSHGGLDKFDWLHRHPTTDDGGVEYSLAKSERPEAYHADAQGERRRCEQDAKEVTLA